MDHMGESSGNVPLQLTRKVDELCDEFEKRIEGGEEVDLSLFIKKIEPEGRRLLLEETLPILVGYLRRHGCPDPVRAIIDKNPILRVEIENALVESADLGETAIFEQSSRGDAVPELTPRGKKSRGLRIRCPHCSNHVELVGDTPFDSVKCNVCGSTFSLVDQKTDTRMAQALQKIDRFELISRIGVGGFGTVWKARDTELERTVAVKIPRQGQLTDVEMEQFLREARSVAQLRHPNIVHVHEVGREADTVFIVSDLIRGVSLADLLTGKKLTPREAAELCATIAKALDHAHRKGIIHRDLKPSNVMIEDDGTPYLMDFGLAKREAEEVTMTIEGQIVGTPAYMSPEQAVGKSGWADRRADVYSLGVILFELLTGELPFRGNAQMQVQQRLSEDAPNALKLNRHIPLDLATICAKCLEREPGQRYQTAKEVSDEFGRYLDHLPIKARPLSLPQRLIRWSIRRPFQAAVAGLLMFLLIGGLSTALVINSQNRSLEQLVLEQANLIKKREQENRNAISITSRLQDQLDVWEGGANLWAMWPPKSSNSPKRRQLASLLAARGATLQQPDLPSNSLENAQRFLALATLYEATENREKAERSLLDAADALADLLKDQGRSLSISLALAECYDRLSSLSSDSDRKKSILWLKKSLELRRRLAEERLGDPLLQAFRLDAEMRSGAAAGFDSAQIQLAEAQRLNATLGALWPESPTEIYHLACQLAGLTPWLEAPQPVSKD